MHRIILLIGLLAFAVYGHAQPEQYSKARVHLAAYHRDHNRPDLEKAHECIDRAARHDSTKNLAKTWLLHGQIFVALYLQEVENNKLKYNYLDVATRTKSSLAETGDSLIRTAGNSLLKCLELDTGQQYKEATDRLLHEIVSINQSAGVAKFSTEQFQSARNCFYQAFVLQQANGRFDSLLLFNSAISAMKTADYAQSIKWSKELLARNYNAEGSSWVLAQSYLETGNYAGADTIIRKSLERFPESGKLKIQFIEQRLLVGDTASADSVVLKMNRIQGIPGAMDALQMADYYRFLVIDPDTYSQRMGKRSAESQLINRAEFWYAQALKVQPALFEARYNLGTLYYNLGVREKKKDQSANGAGNGIWRDWFLKAAIELEAALKLRSKDMAVLDALKSIYTQLGDEENYQRIKESEK